jgi:farnesyl diphosphate synthase
MSFAHELDTAARLVEARLTALLSDRELPNVPSPLIEAMRYATLGGGKRFRPFLVQACAGLFDVDPAQPLEVGAAVECLHCYSLVHDDLPAMDDDDMRRGRPTVHRAFDEATAILAGDALLTLAFEILLRPPTHPDAAVRAELALQLARSSGPQGMAGGQQLDLVAETIDAKSLRLADVQRIQSLKTGALITFCCEAGAILARTSDIERQALRRYGNALGLAFQISDDLLDAEGDAGAMGKAARKDEAAGKATFVSLLGLDGARIKLAETQRDAEMAIARFGNQATNLRAAVSFMSERQN